MAKLARFQKTKYFFCSLKPTSLTRFSPQCRQTIIAHQQTGAPVQLQPSMPNLGALWQTELVGRYGAGCQTNLSNIGPMIQYQLKNPKWRYRYRNLVSQLVCIMSEKIVLQLIALAYWRADDSIVQTVWSVCETEKLVTI